MYDYNLIVISKSTNQSMMNTNQFSSNIIVKRVNNKYSKIIPLCVVTLFNMLLFFCSIYLYINSKYNESKDNDKFIIDSSNDESNTTHSKLLHKFTYLDANPNKIDKKNTNSTTYPTSVISDKTLNEPCIDPLWCNIPMPTKSYYHFDPPTDMYKWHKAKIQASKGEQVLLKHIIKVFPNHYDFIDGDITFRKLHYTFDFFVDEYRDLSPLVPPSIHLNSIITSKVTSQYKYRDNIKSKRKLKKQNSIYTWENEGKSVIPEPYDFRSMNRSAIVSIGYTAYQRDSQTYFSGNRLGGAFLDKLKFFEYWLKVKDYIDLPFISICTLNENWGMLSTMFPNRTAAWGKCCNSNSKKDKLVFEFLNHPKTLMLVTNQHVNISHPKLLIMPRGIPITWGSTRIIIWDSMRSVLKFKKKETLLFAAASSWGPRPQILKCVSDKVPAKYFDGHSSSPRANKLDREQYYIKLGSAMFGLGLPGLGYDCFRAWELMTMGSIVVLERGVGFDRTMYRLPALFVEDFDEITEDLLRTAYVEALYRAEDFEYKRLTQSFWYSVIANVSATMSVQTILNYFPMEAEEKNFARPRVPYECGKTNSCGEGVKRTPKRSC